MKNEIECLVRKKKRRRPSWDEVFMKTLPVFEERVTCIHYKVVAILADSSSGQFFSLGYNGPVRGAPHCSDVGCQKEMEGKKLPAGSGKCVGLHAEINAFLNVVFLGSVVDFKKATLYISVRPCLDCAKAIVNVGIKRVIYRGDYDSESNVFDFLDKQGVELIKFSDFLKKTETKKQTSKKTEMGFV